ncbi:hypothetical protein ACWEPC_17290 [Nonomuraea sp. NPDC004297]
MSERVLTRYGAGYLRTTICGTDDGGYLVIREPGPLRETDLRLSPLGRRAAEGSFPLPGSFQLPETAVAPLRFTVPQPVPLIDRMLWPAAFSTTAHLLPPALKAAGAALRELTDLPIPDGIPTGMPELGRLLRWLRSGGGNARDGARGNAQRLYKQARWRLGPDMWTELTETCGLLCARPERVIHGNPTLSGVFPRSTATGGVTILTGETLTAGPADFDISWLTGELLMHHLLSDGANDLDHAGLARAALEGYGLDSAPAQATPIARLRLLHHVLSYVVHVNWRDDLVDRLGSIQDKVPAWIRAL